MTQSIEVTFAARKVIQIAVIRDIICCLCDDGTIWKEGWDGYNVKGWVRYNTDMITLAPLPALPPEPAQPRATRGA